MRYVLIAVSILLFSCSKKDSVPGDILQKTKMQEVLWDFIRADALTTQHQNAFGSTAAWIDNIQLQKQVFAIHKITKEQFYSSLDYYINHPKIMEPMLDSMAEKAKRDRPVPVILNQNLTK